MRFVLALCIFIIGWGCQQSSESEAKKHPDIGELLASDTAYLKQNRHYFTKILIRNGSKEQIRLATDSVDWQKEWVFLWSADISNPALIGKYREVPHEDSTEWVAQDEQLRVQRLVTYGAPSQLAGFSAHIQNISFLHQVHYWVRYRSVSQDTSEGAFYTVSIMQNIPFVEPIPYTVKGVL